MFLSSSREDALKKIVTLVQQHELSVDEIGAALRANEDKPKASAGNIISKLLSYLGALFIFAGISIYTAIEWEHLSSLSRVIITLGPGIVCFLLGLICLRDEKYSRATTPLFVLGALLQPGGLIVYLNEYFEPTGNTALALAGVFGIVALQQAAAFVSCRRTALLFFTVLYAYGAAAFFLTWLDLDEQLWGVFLSFSGLCTTYAIARTRYNTIAPVFTLFSGFCFVASCFTIAAESPPHLPLLLVASALYGGVIVTLSRSLRLPHPVFMFFVMAPYLAFVGTGLESMKWASSEWVAMIVGTAGMMSAYGLSKGLHKGTSPALYFIFGLMASYAAHDIVLESPFEALLIGYGAGLMYLSVVIGSRTLLFVSVVSVLGFLASFTDRYFADVVGWPIALIGLGLALILISSYAMKLSQKIVTGKKSGA